MTQDSLLERITRIAEPAARAHGLEIWGIELVPAGRTLLRIYLDAPQQGATDAALEAEQGTSQNAEQGAAQSTGQGSQNPAPEEEQFRESGGSGPSIDQCARVSRHVALALEAEELFPGPYVLELSSPGLERPFFSLAQLRPYLGCQLELRLRQALPELPGCKRLRGLLLAVETEELLLRPNPADRAEAQALPEQNRLPIAWNNVLKARLLPELPFSQNKKPGKKSAPKDKIK